MCIFDGSQKTVSHQTNLLSDTLVVVLRVFARLLLLLKVAAVHGRANQVTLVHF